MYIYKITNDTDGKVYIGQTIRPVKSRFNRHICDAINDVLDTHFARAIRKYGPEHFSIEIIDTASSAEELTKKEAYWINKYNSTNPKYGYNETDSIFKCGGNTYKSKTEAELDEIGEKIRETKLGSLNPNSKRIKCLNTVTGEEITFDSAIECQTYFGEKNHRFITTRVLHEVRGLYKSIWAISYIDDEYKYDKVVNKKGRKVIVKADEEDEKTYESIRLMCRELGFARSKVTQKIREGENEFRINQYTITILN